MSWKRPYVAIDTETSGLLPHGRMLEVAAVRCDVEGNVLGVFNAIVRPEGLPPWHTQPGVRETLTVNGLDPDLVGRGIGSFNERLWSWLLGFVSASETSEPPIVVAHCASFDRSIIAQEYEFANTSSAGLLAEHVPWPSSLNRVVCTLGCDAILRPSAKSRKLAATAERWGVVLPAAAHRATADAMTCAAIFAQQMKEMGDGLDTQETDATNAVHAMSNQAAERYFAERDGRHQ